MIIQLNTDKSLTIHELFGDKLNDLLTDELSRFSDFITRIEVYFSDEDGVKKGVDDKKCLLEARLKGRQPIAVSDLGNTYEMAVIGAIDKLKNSLETIVGKMND